MHRMNIGASKWVCGLALVIGGCDPHGGGNDGEDDGETTVGDSAGTSETTAASGYDDEGSASITTFGEEGTSETTLASGVSEGCSESDSASTTSTTSTSATTTVGEDDDGGTESGSAAEQCGIELEYADVNNSFICACEECSVQYDGLTDESADAFLGACDCICEALGCGATIGGGVTGEGGSEDGDGTASGTGESGWGGESDAGSTTTPYEDG
jgi:hypothetical protein